MGAGVVVVDAVVVGGSVVTNTVNGSFFLLFPSLFFEPTPFIWTHTNLPGVALISANLKKVKEHIYQNRRMSIRT